MSIDTGIPFVVGGTQFGALLQSGIPEVGNLYTYRHGGCAAFELHVGFHSNPGDQETLKVAILLNMYSDNCLCSKISSNEGIFLKTFRIWHR
jgi:hypothetical protein